MSESDQSRRPDWKRFHRELQAAVTLGVPVELGKDLTFASETTAGRLHEFEAQLLYELDDAGKLRPDFSNDQRYPSRYRAAAKIFESTGDMRIVLDGLAVQANSRRMLSRMVRPTAIYLISLFLIGMVGFAFFAYIAVPVIESMRKDLVLLPAVEIPQRVDWGLWLRPIAMALPVLFLFVLFLVCWRGGVWVMTSWLGGMRFEVNQSSASALQASLLLMNRGMKSEPAVSIGCDLVGVSPVTRGKIIEAVRGHIVPADYAFEASKQHIQNLIHRFHNLADQKLQFVRVIVPNIFVLGVGGLGVSAYCIALFWPMITLLLDLSLPLK